MKQLTYDPADLRPVAALGSSSYVMAVPPELGVKTLKAFVDLAKSKPKELNFGFIPMNIADRQDSALLLLWSLWLW